MKFQERDPRNRKSRGDREVFWDPPDQTSSWECRQPGPSSESPAVLEPGKEFGFRVFGRWGFYSLGLKKKTKPTPFVFVCVFRQIYCYCCFLVAKSCLTLCNPMDCRLPGSPVHGISQARILEWVAIPFSRESSQHPWGSSLSLLHWQANSLPLSHQGSSYRYTCRERGERDLKNHYNLP